MHQDWTDSPNLHRDCPLTFRVAARLLIDSAIPADTMVVPGEMEAQAVQACLINPIYTLDATFENPVSSLGLKIVTLPELTLDGHRIDQTTWYLALCGDEPPITLTEGAGADLYFHGVTEIDPARPPREWIQTRSGRFRREPPHWIGGSPTATTECLSFTLVKRAAATVSSPERLHRCEA